MERDNLHEPEAEKRTSKRSGRSKLLWLKVIVFLAVCAHPAQAVTLRTNANEPKKETMPPNAYANLSEISDKDIEKDIANPALRNKIVSMIVQEKTEELQDEVIKKISQLQSDVKAANRQGRKKQFIKKLFKKVSSVSLSGDQNYCTAGAMYGYCSIDDAMIKQIVNEIIAGTDVLPRDLNLFSHPNISCPAFKAYYKQVLGANFIDRQSPDFAQQIKSLEKGDVILLYSSQNTSSGLHCVTVEKNEDNKIYTKGLNSETDAIIKDRRICCIAKFPKQFKQNFAKELAQNDELLISLIKSNPRLYARLAIQLISSANAQSVLFPMFDSSLSSYL